MERDRNLLFGVFAVQLHKVTPGQLVEAAAGWAADPSRSLADRLVQGGALASKDRDLIDRFVGEAVRAHAGDVAATLANFGGREEVQRTFMGALGITDSGDIVPLRRLSPGTGTVIAGVPGVQETPGRYTHVSEYAKGGMGRVLLAHDSHLGRDIALKELLPISDAPDDAASPIRLSMHHIARFLQEARVTGQLEHPAIVPVYELGHRHDGTLYYTMKLVRGRTLAQALREAKGLKGRLELIPHFADLCQAMGYAHRRLVIHRDLKPSNVMVGEFGETVVIDWGLAKVQGAEDAHADGLAETIRLLNLGDEDEAARTAYGQFLGTPAYVPPEQALGQLEKVDERSDVYSLGALLYELLTGRPPFTGSSAKDVIHKVLAGPPAWIPSIEPQAPPELVAICNRAMARDPAERYATAKELAEEVRRFLSGALVQTHAYRFSERLSRFIRRNRAPVATAAAAFVLILVIGIISYLRVVHERDNAISAHRSAEQSREEAVRARELTERAGYHTSLLLARELADRKQFAQANEVLWTTPETLRNWEWGHLLYRCNMDALTLEGHTASVICANFRPDGTRAVTSSRDGTARAWNLSTGECLLTLKATIGEVATAMYSPDGRTILTASPTETIVIWNAETGKKERTFGDAISEPVFVGSFDPAGAHIAAGMFTNDVVVWNTLTGARQWQKSGHSNFAWSISYSPDGARIVTGSRDNTLRVWDAATGAELANLGQHLSEVRDAVFSPSGKFLASGGFDKTARVWDAQTFLEVARFDVPSSVTAVAFTPDEHGILIGSQDQIVRLCDIPSRKQRATFEGHSEAILDIAVDGTEARMLTASADGTAKLWRLNDPGHQIEAIPVPGASVAFSPDGSVLAVGSQKGPLRLLRTASGTEIRLFGGFGVRRVSWNSDGKRLLIVTSGGEALNIDVEHATLEAIHPAGAGRYVGSRLLQDGTQLVTASVTGRLALTDLVSGTVLQHFTSEDANLSAIGASTDGALLATGAENGTVRLWGLANGKEAAKLESHASELSCLAFDQPGERLATASLDGLVCVWNVSTASPAWSAKAHVSSVLAAAFSPDGSRLVTGSKDGSVCFLDANRGEVIFTLTEPGYQIQDVAWSADGSRLAVGTSGRTYLWTAMPWHSNSLPGPATLPWRDRFKRYKRERLIAIPAAQSPQELPVHHVFMTRHNLQKRLSRLAQVLRQEELPPEENPTSGPATGLTITAGARLESVPLLTIASGDRLIGINGLPIDDKTQALRVLESGAGGLDQQTEDLVSLAIERDGAERTINIHLVAPIDSKTSTQLSRLIAIPALQQGIAGFQQGTDTVVRWSRDYSQIYDLPVFGSEIDGFWPDQINRAGTSDPQAVATLESIYASIGVQFLDHIVRLNGAPLTSVEALLTVLREGLEVLQRGEPYTFTLDIERGLFQHVTLDINVV